MRRLVEPNLELPARELTVAVEADQLTRENVFAGMIDPIVDPTIPGDRCFLFAQAETAPVYVSGFFNSTEAPKVSTGPIQGVYAVQIRGVFDFGVGAGAVDWRGG